MNPPFFRSTWSNSLKLTTSLTLAILAIIFIFGGPIGAVFSGVLLLASLLLMINGYSIEQGKVVVHGLLWRRIFDLCELVDITVEPGITSGSKVNLGFSGVFSALGNFTNPVLGDYQCFSTDSKNAVVIDFVNKRIVVSPADPEAFREAVMAESNRIHV